MRSSFFDENEVPGVISWEKFSRTKITKIYRDAIFKGRQRWGHQNRDPHLTRERSNHRANLSTTDLQFFANSLCLRL
jgi:hypothetical protein